MHALEVVDETRWAEVLGSGGRGERGGDGAVEELAAPLVPPAVEPSTAILHIIPASIVLRLEERAFDRRSEMGWDAKGGGWTHMHVSRRRRATL